MGLVDLAHQVMGRLGWRSGGTGNPNGWGTAVVSPHVNWSTSATLPLGTLVRLRNGSQVEPTTTDSETTVYGVVVGYFGGAFQDTFVAADCPIAGMAAVMTKGRCLVLIAADVSKGDYAFADATDGQAKGSGTLAAGAFGTWASGGVTTVTGYAWVELFGAPVFGAGGGGTFGTPAFSFSTAGAAGSTDEVVRRDSTIALFDGTTPASITLGGSGSVGTAGKAPRRDHVHPMSALKGAVVVTFYAPTNGLQADFVMPFAGTWVRWTLLADASGSAVVDVWEDTYANYPPTVADAITGGGKPTISSATKGQGTTITSAFSLGDTVRANIDSVSGIARLTLIMEYTRTQ